jgi:hypothetical protein
MTIKFIGEESLDSYNKLTEEEEIFIKKVSIYIYVINSLVRDVHARELKMGCHDPLITSVGSLITLVYNVCRRETQEY